MADDDLSDSHPGKGASEPTDEDLKREVERLRAEEDQLRAKVDALQARPQKRNRVRRVLAPILAALTIVTFTLAVPGVWSRRTVFDSDRYVATVTPLASDPAVQAYLARQLTDWVFATVDVQAKIVKALPEQAQLLAGPITSAAHGFVQAQVTKLLASDAFQTFWVQANQFLHEQVIAVLRGQGDTVAVQSGQVVLNLLPVVDAALAQVQSSAQALVGSKITIPKLSVDQVPEQAIARVEAALGVTLPSDFGQIVVFRADQLHSLQTAVDRFNRLVVALVVIALLFFALTLVVSMRRRRSLIQMAAGIAIGLVLVRRIAIAAGDHVVGLVRSENRGAARAVSDALFSGLFRSTRWLLWIALVTLLVALLTGPYPWAVRLRAWTAGIATAAVGGLQTATPDPAADWVRAHRDLLLLAGGAVGLVALLVFNLSLLGVTVLAVVVAVYELLVFRVGAPPSGT
jgi:hypothetical protein